MPNLLKFQQADKKFIFQQKQKTKPNGQTKKDKTK